MNSSERKKFYIGDASFFSWIGMNKKKSIDLNCKNDSYTDEDKSKSEQGALNS